MKMENQDGKRVARGPGMPRGGKIALAVVLVLVLALLFLVVALTAGLAGCLFQPVLTARGTLLFLPGA